MFLRRLELSFRGKWVVSNLFWKSWVVVRDVRFRVFG